MTWFLVNLAGKLATLGPDSRSDLGRRFYCPLTKRRVDKTHYFVEFIHLREYWQFFASLENFAILRRMGQSGERVFIAVLRGRQIPVETRYKTRMTYHDTLHLFCGNMSRQKAEERMFCRTSHDIVQDRVAQNLQIRKGVTLNHVPYPHILYAPGTWLYSVVLASAERSCKDNNLARFITRLSLTMSTDASLLSFLFSYPLVVPYLFYSFSLCSFSFLSANSQVTSANLSWQLPI